MKSNGHYHKFIAKFISLQPSLFFFIFYRNWELWNYPKFSILELLGPGKIMKIHDKNSHFCNFLYIWVILK